MRTLLKKRRQTKNKKCSGFAKDSHYHQLTWICPKCQAPSSFPPPHQGVTPQPSCCPSHLILITPLTGNLLFPPLTGSGTFLRFAPLTWIPFSPQLPASCPLLTRRLTPILSIPTSSPSPSSSPSSPSQSYSSFSSSSSSSSTSSDSSLFFPLGCHFTAQL